MNDKIKNLIENKDILLFTDSEINSIFPKYVIVRRSNNRLTEGILTEIFTNDALEEKYGVVDVDFSNGCKVISIQIKDKKLYKILDDEEFNLLKIITNSI